MTKRLITILALTAALALAQGGRPVQTPERADSGGPGGPGGRGGPGGGMRGTTLQKLTQSLTLDKDQQAQVKTIMQDAAKEAVPFRDDVNKTRAALALVLQDQKPQAELDQASKAFVTASTQMTKVEMTAMAHIFALLNNDQKRRSGNALAVVTGVFMKKNWDSED
jgi:Spy/CpxP family protein refolding chaperone